MTYQLYMASFTVLRQHNHCVTLQPLYLSSNPLYLCGHTQCTNLSNPVYVWYNSRYMFDNICTTDDITYTLYDITTLYYIKSSISDIISPISDLMSILSVSSHPLYRWHHSHSMYDLHYICTTDDITSPPSHQTTAFMMSHPLQAWHHTNFFRHRSHCIFVITTSPWISHPFLYDITPTLCVISYALYITSPPLFRT